LQWLIPLELPGLEASDVQVEQMERWVHAGILAIVGELDFKFHLILRYGLLADYAFGSDARDTPGAISSTRQDGPGLDRCSGLFA